MYYGLKNLPATPNIVADQDVYQALLTIHKALQSAEFSFGAGWASYTDTLRTRGSPQAIGTGATATILNNAGAKVQDYLPVGVPSFYDATLNKVLAVAVGDYYLLTIRFKCRPSHYNIHLDFSVDIGGTLIYKQTVPLVKGAGIEEAVEFICPFPQGSLVGAIPKVTVVGGSLELYEAEFHIVRVFSMGGF